MQLIRLKSYNIWDMKWVMRADMSFCRGSYKARYMELKEWAKGEYRG